MAAVMICVAFTACSSVGKEEEKEVNTTAVPTEAAKVKETEAIHFIESAYTKEELGLAQVDKNYSFMVASNGVEIDGKNYIKVVANVIVRNDVTTEDGKETFSMETKGEYYISFDGKEVLMKNMENGKFVKLENRYDSFKDEESTQTSADTTAENTTEG